MAAAPIYAISKLNGSNYLDWANDIKYLLIDRGLWDIIDKSLSIPEKSATVSDADIEKFQARASHACSTIYMNIEPAYRKLLEGCKDNPVVLWNKIKQCYFPDDRAFHMKLFSQLMATKKRPDETINLFAANLLQISNKLIDVYPTYDDIHTKFQLLRFLPSSFDGIVDDILGWEDKDFEFDKILRALIRAESRMGLREHDRGQSNSRAQAFFNQRKRYNPKKKVTCWRCHKVGHVKSQCRVRDPSVQSDSSASSASTNNSRNFSKNQGRGGDHNSQYDKRDSSQDSFSGPNNFNGHFSKKDFKNKKEKSSCFYISQCNLNERDKSGDWIFDSGASHHFCSVKGYFHDFIPLTDENMAIAVKDVVFPIEGYGKLVLRFGSKVVTFEKVMYSPKLRHNLISGSRIDKKGGSFVGKNGEIKVFDNGDFRFNAIRKKGFYYLHPQIIKPKIKKVVTFESPEACNVEQLQTWHRRFGHASQSIIENTFRKNCVRGLSNLGSGDLVCESCKLGKFRHVSFKALKDIRSKNPLDLIYSDIWGPSPVEGRQGERYFVSVIDDYSRRAAIYPLRLKSEAFDVVRDHILRAENQLGRKVKHFRSDNGKEYVNMGMDKFLRSKGIKHELTNVYSPQQNGVAEKFNQIVVDGGRTLLIDSGLDHSFWPEALKCFTYTWNRVCTKKLKRTPFESYHGFKPSVRHLKSFGCTAFVGVPRQRRHKLEPKAKHGILVGYAYRTRGYRIWIPEENKIIETINTSFNEQKFFKSGRSGAVMGPDSPEIENLNGDEEYSPQPRVRTTDADADSQVEGSTRRTPPEKKADAEDKVDPGDLREVRWIRVPVKRSTGRRTDIYYYEEGKQKKLRSENDVINYCKSEGIIFHPELFTFQGADPKSGVVEFNSVSDGEVDEDDEPGNSVANA